MPKQRRDNQVELLRFLFAFLIMVYHSHLINGVGHPIKLGKVFVEFFFFLSGYYTYAHIEKKCKEDNSFEYQDSYAIAYTLNKYKKFLPYLLLCAFVYYAAMILPQLLSGNLAGIKATLLSFSAAPFDFLLLQALGICRNSCFNAWWYLSAMLFVLPLVVMVFQKARKNGEMAWVQYVFPLLIYAYFAVKFTGVEWDVMIGPIRSGLLRAFAGLCMGGNIFVLSEKLAIFKLHMVRKALVTVIEFCSYAIAIVIAWKHPDIDNSTFLIIFMLMTALIITMSKVSFSTMLNWKVFGFLGKISMPLYICHYSVGRMVYAYTGERIGLTGRYILYFGGSVLFAFLAQLIVEGLSGKRKRETS